MQTEIEKPCRSVCSASIRPEHFPESAKPADIPDISLAPLSFQANLPVTAPANQFQA